MSRAGGGGQGCEDLAARQWLVALLGARTLQPVTNLKDFLVLESGAAPAPAATPHSRCCTHSPPHRG